MDDQSDELTAQDVVEAGTGKSET